MTTLRRIACWISKATRAQAQARACAPTHRHVCMHTHAHINTEKYVTLIPFPQQCYREFASTLCYTCIACRVLFLTVLTATVTLLSSQPVAIVEFR